MVDSTNPTAMADVTTADTTTPVTPPAPSMPTTPTTPTTTPTGGPAPVPVPSTPTPTTPTSPAASNDTGDDIGDVADDLSNNIDESLNDAQNELEGDDAEDVAGDVGDNVQDAVDDVADDVSGDDEAGGGSGETPTSPSTPTSPGTPSAQAPAGVYGLQPTEVLDTDVLANAEHFYRSSTRAYNDSGAEATVLLAHDMDSGTVTAIVQAMGVEAGQLHPQHIHSFIDGKQSILPASTRDGDGDGYVEAAGTIPDLGAIRIPLTLSDTGGYPRAVADQQAADPGTDSPTAPGTDSPTDPSGEAPTTPVGDPPPSDSPTDPSGEMPTTPVGDPPPGETPTAPGVEAPTDGGAATPSNPSTTDDAGSASGMYYFAETYDVPESITSFELTTFDLHGLTVPEGVGAGTGLEVDGTGGYKAALPIAAGRFTEISASEAIGLFAELSQPAFEDARMEDLLAFDSAYQSEALDLQRNSVEDFRETLLSLAEDYGSGSATQAEFNSGVTEAQSALETELAGFDDLDTSPATGDMNPGSDMMMA